MKEIKVGYELIRPDRYGRGNRGLLFGRYKIAEKVGSMFRLSYLGLIIKAPYTAEEIDRETPVAWLTTLDYYLCDGCIK